MADDDDDDVAIDEGMEPESPTGADPGDDDDDDGDDGVAAGGPVSRTMDAPRGTRQISDRTRELARKIAEANKGKGDASDPDLPGDDDIDYDEAPTGAPITPGAAAAALVTDPGAVAAVPPAPPPAATLDPEVTRLREEWTRKSAELEERESKLATAEQSGDLAALAEQYFERGAPAIVEILKKWEGVDGEQLKDALADLVSDLTIHMGVEVPQEVKDRLEAKRTRKQVQRMRSQQAQTAERGRKEQEAAQDEQNRVRVKGILQQEITKPEHAPSYPWLTAEPNPGEIVFDVVQAAFKKDGTRLTWQEAAKRANDYLNTQSRAWFDKRAHLLTTATGGAPAGGQQQRTQGGQQVRRSQAPQQVSPPVTPPAPEQPQKWDPEAHRKAIKAKHGPKLRAAFTEHEE